MSSAFRKIKVGSVSIPIYRSRHQSTASGFVFTVCYYDSGKVRRQLQRASIEAAEKEARLIATNLSACNAEAAAFSSHDREELLAARRLCGETPLLSALKELAAAKRLVDDNLLVAAQHWADGQNRQFEPKYLRDVTDEYVSVKAAAGKRVGDNHASEFRNIKAELGNRYVHDISTAEINRWLQRRSNPWTVMTYRKRIIAIFRWAQRYGYIPRGGQTAAEFSELPSTPTAPIGIISPDCFRKLLFLIEANSPRDIPALILAGMCGLRRAEVHKQRWEDIHLDRGVLTVSSAKKGTDSYRNVPLCSAARAWLAPFQQPRGPVCEGMAVDRVRKLGQKAGLALPDNAFRHSFVSYRVAQTQKRSQVALEAGHSEKMLTKHYKENVTEEDAEAWFSVFPKAAETEV